MGRRACPREARLRQLDPALPLPAVDRSPGNHELPGGPAFPLEVGPHFLEQPAQHEESGLGGLHRRVQHHLRPESRRRDDPPQGTSAPAAQLVPTAQAFAPQPPANRLPGKPHEGEEILQAPVLHSPDELGREEGHRRGHPRVEIRVRPRLLPGRGRAGCPGSPLRGVGETHPQGEAGLRRLCRQGPGLRDEGRPRPTSQVHRHHSLPNLFPARGEPGGPAGEEGPGTRLRRSIPLVQGQAGTEGEGPPDPLPPLHPTLPGGTVRLGHE